MPKRTLSASIALLLSPLAVAETPHVELDPINITVSRSPQAISQTPARVSVIGEREITQNPTANLSDVLKKEASIYIKQTGGIGQGTELYLRGGLPTHTLLLKDGARLNTQNGFSPNYTEQISLNGVNRIEIVKGASSVQYGTDAINGTIQLISQTPTNTHAFATAVFGENDTNHYSAGADIVHNGFFAQINGQRLDSDGTHILNTQHKAQKAGFDQKGFGAKLGYDSTHHKAHVFYHQNEGNNIYMDYSTQQNNKVRQFKNNSTGVNLEVTPQNNLTVNAQYALSKDTQTWIDGTDTPYQPNNKNTDANLTARWHFTPNQNLLAGVAYSKNQYKTNTLATHTKIDSLGYYLQHQYQSDKVNTQLGVRLEDNDRFGNHTVGQGSIRYHLTPKASVYTNIGSSFKAPYLDQLYSKWGGNTELKPEKGLSYEVGADYFIDDDTKVYVSAFQNKLTNLISSVCIDKCDSTNSWERINQNQNIDKAQLTGGEVGVTWSKDDFYASAEYAYVATKNKSGVNQDKELPYRPKHTGTLSVGYDNGIYGVGTSMTAHSKSFADRANTNYVRGYYTADLNAHWHINSNVKLFTNIKNYWGTDHKLVDNFGSWYMSGGRQANIGITVSY